MKEMIGKSIRYILTLAALGMTVLQPVNGGGAPIVTRYQNLIAFLYMCLGWIVTIVAIAALMRKDLERIENQEKKFEEVRNDIKGLLGELKTVLEALATKRGQK